MTDCITLNRGHWPWQPSDGAVLEEVLHEFTVPLIGVLKQEGVQFLFWCVVGSGGPESAWAYARLDRYEDINAMRGASAIEFLPMLINIVKGRTSQFAFATDDHGISESVIIDPPADFETIFYRGMTAIREKFSEVARELEESRGQLEALRKAGQLGIQPSDPMHRSEKIQTARA